jgi:hypothetical protein
MYSVRVFAALSPLVENAGAIATVRHVSRHCIVTSAQPGHMIRTLLTCSPGSRNFAVTDLDDNGLGRAAAISRAWYSVCCMPLSTSLLSGLNTYPVVSILDSVRGAVLWLLLKAMAVLKQPCNEYSTQQGEFVSVTCLYQPPFVRSQAMYDYELWQTHI